MSCFKLVRQSWGDIRQVGDASITLQPPLNSSDSICGNLQLSLIHPPSTGQMESGATKKLLTSPVELNKLCRNKVAASCNFGGDPLWQSHVSAAPVIWPAVWVIQSQRQLYHIGSFCYTGSSGFPAEDFRFPETCPEHSVVFDSLFTT